MVGTCLPVKLFPRDFPHHISSPQANESRRSHGESIHCLVKVKELSNDCRSKYGQHLRNSADAINKRQRAPVFCLSEESSSTSIFICDAIMQKSDTALETLRTRRQEMIGSRSSQSFCSISHSDLPKFCYPDSVLTVTPHQTCTACSQENVACQAPDEHCLPPVRAFKAIQVNLCHLEKSPTVNFRKSSWRKQCISCGGSVPNIVSGDSSAKEKCNEESYNHGVTISKGNLCPCFIALEQKRDECLLSNTGKIQDSEQVSNNIEICMPISEQQNSSSWPETPTLLSVDNNKEACSQCCERETLGSVTCSHINEAHVTKYHVSIEQHREQNVGLKCQSQHARRILKNTMFGQNIIKKEDSAKQLVLSPKANQCCNTDTNKSQAGHHVLMQYPFPQRKCVRAKEKTHNRVTLPPVCKKPIKRPTFHPTHQTAIFHLKITKSNQEPQQNTKLVKQHAVKQGSFRAGSAVNVPGVRWSKDSATRICRQIVPTIHSTSPHTKVASNLSTDEHKRTESAPCASSLPLWKNIVQFLKKTFLPTSADSLAELCSHESQVDSPELLYLLEKKENKLKCLGPGLSRSFSDVNPQQLFKLENRKLHRYAPMKSRAKKPCQNERNCSWQNSALSDAGYGLHKQNYSAIKKSVKFFQSKSTLGVNSDHIETSSSVNHKQKSRKHIAGRDSVSTHEIRSKINNIKPVSRSLSCSQNTRRNSFTVPINCSTGDKQNSSCSKDTKARQSPKLLSSTSRSHSAITTKVSRMWSSTLPERINLRDRPSIFRQRSCDYSLQKDMKKDPY